jgi:hypothetical protein
MHAIRGFKADSFPLEDRRGDLPEFPHETIPSGLQGWLLLATRGAGVRTDRIAAAEV